MTPNFIIIGAARSGTTSLFQYLDPHPEIFMSPVKELNFFSNEYYWQKGFHWYESRFSDATPEHRAIGEASTSYTKAPFTANVPKRIYDYAPDIKLIYMVRNPIDRLLSHYMKRVENGIEQREFDDVLKDLKQESTAWQGLYYHQLTQYEEWFPQDQLLVLSMADLKNEPDKIVRTIYEFLGVDPNFNGTDIRKTHNATPTAIRKSGFGLQVMKFYRRYIEQRNVPFRLKKTFLTASELGGKEISKPILNELQIDLLKDFYRDDSHALKKNYNIKL